LTKTRGKDYCETFFRGRGGPKNVPAIRKMMLAFQGMVGKPGLSRNQKLAGREMVSKAVTQRWKIKARNV